MNNHADKKKHGTTARGERIRKQLTETDVLSIRSLYAAGIKQKQIAMQFGVVQSMVSAIVLGKVWTHIGG